MAKLKKPGDSSTPRGSSGGPCGVPIPARSCSEGVFVDQSAEAIASTKPRLSERRYAGTRAAAELRRGQVEAAVRPVRVVVVDIEVEDACEVASSEDEHPVLRTGR